MMNHNKERKKGTGRERGTQGPPPEKIWNDEEEKNRGRRRERFVVAAGGSFYRSSDRLCWNEAFFKYCWYIKNHCRLSEMSPEEDEM
jgi:hypothetical protein